MSRADRWYVLRGVWRAALYALVIALVATALNGCAVIGDKRTAAGCQLADGITTKQAMDRGATESNPFLSSASGSQILAFKALISGLIIYFGKPYEEASPTERVLMGALSIIGCGAAIHNQQVQR